MKIGQEKTRRSSPFDGARQAAAETNAKERGSKEHGHHCEEGAFSALARDQL